MTRADRVAEMEKHAREFVAGMIETATAMLASSAVDEQDRADVERAIVNLGHADWLIAKLKSLPAADAEHSLECLWSALAGTFIVSSRCLTSRSGERYVRRSNASKARAAKAPAIAKLQQLVMQACRESKIKTSTKIQESLREKHGVEISDRTVRRYLGIRHRDGDRS